MAGIMAASEASGYVERILKILGSSAFKKISLRSGTKDKLVGLEKSLFALECVLQDAGEQQSSNLIVRDWLRRLIGVACDVEDILDRISTEELEGRVKASSILRKVAGMFYNGLDHELSISCGKLKEIADDCRVFGLKQRRSRESVEETTHSFVAESMVFGREDDKEWVVNCLLKLSEDDANNTQPHVLPIVAIGGMGKTTLLQLVMDDDRVAQMFEVRIWACISKDFDLHTAVLRILESATNEGSKYSSLSLDALQRKLREVLLDKIYFIVLDNVWIEDSKRWLRLKYLLAVGRRGSTIVVTTREERVASLTGTMKPYKLKELSEEDSLTMFLDHAFSEGEEKAHPLLVEIGRSIIKKCRGVPLAVKSLGSLLRHKRDYTEWEKIEESELWEIDQGRNDILPSLKLSLYYAPLLLRLCFTSCAIFGKGYPLYRSDLISLWMGHGFLQSEDGSTEDALDLGDRCFDELISRSFFQLPDYSITKKHAMVQEEDFTWMHGRANHSHMAYTDAISQEFRSCDGKVICVEMHDLMHDLASYIVGNEIEVGKKTGYHLLRTKHLVWDRKQQVEEDFPVDLLGTKSIRTFAFLYPMARISKSFLDTLFTNFRCLRILIFICCSFDQLPESLGNLKHLRYLDLRGNSQLHFLPRSLCNLVNLKVLDLGECGCLEMLPENVNRLISLRTLVLSFRFKRLNERALRGWTSLQVLKLTFCPNLESLSEEFGSLKSLRVLLIRVCDSLVHLPNSIGSLTNLEHLTLESCRELDLAGWKGLRDLVSLRILVIDDLPGLLEIPDMGNAARTLQYMKVSNCMSFRSFTKSLGHCFSLLKLQVFNCPKLKSLKSGIQGLTTLQELRILRCPELSRKCEREIGKYWHLIKRIPEVYTDECYVPTKQAQAGTNYNINGINKEEAKGLMFLFGEAYEFEKQMLIQLWMALGILSEEPMEENGAYYFENLVSEGYLICSVPNYLYRVNLEKLGAEVNIEKQSYFKLDSVTRNSDSSAETVHASVLCDEINTSVFQTLRGFGRLRTLLFLGSYGSRLQQVPRYLFLSYESLEALDVSGTHIKELPSSVGKMINLRYLDLSWTFLEALPERIDRFEKLQTLKLEGCSRLRRLPNEMKGVTGLRHLHIDVLRGLASFPKGMGALVNIRTLSAFPVGTEQGLEISELKYLDHITGSFCIANIENVQSADVAKEAFLNEKKRIKKLSLRWSDDNKEYPTNEAECILQNLCPCSDLEEIEIVGYPGIKLPDWTADVSFDKLASITLFGCANVSMLPSMENLPALQSLELVSLNSLTKMDFKGVAVAFPNLQKLSVDEMLNLETWAEAGEGDYRCIKELSIKDCPKLGQFPSVVYSPTLRHLEVSGCERIVLESAKKLPEFVEQLRVEGCPLMKERCSKDGGQDWHKIRHVPSIWVDHVPI